VVTVFALMWILDHRLTGDNDRQYERIEYRSQMRIS
jgi:hypothetical protein